MREFFSVGGADELVEGVPAPAGVGLFFEQAGQFGGLRFAHGVGAEAFLNAAEGAQGVFAFGAGFGEGLFGGVARRQGQTLFGALAGKVLLAGVEGGGAFGEMVAFARELVHLLRGKQGLAAGLLVGKAFGGEVFFEVGFHIAQIRGAPGQAFVDGGGVAAAAGQRPGGVVEAYAQGLFLFFQFLQTVAGGLFFVVHAAQAEDCAAVGFEGGEGGSEAVAVFLRAVVFGRRRVQCLGPHVDEARLFGKGVAGFHFAGEQVGVATAAFGKNIHGLAKRRGGFVCAPEGGKVVLQGEAFGVGLARFGIKFRAACRDFRAEAQRFLFRTLHVGKSVVVHEAQALHVVGKAASGLLPGVEVAESLFGPGESVGGLCAERFQKCRQGGRAFAERKRGKNVVFPRFGRRRSLGGCGGGVVLRRLVDAALDCKARPGTVGSGESASSLCVSAAASAGERADERKAQLPGGVFGGGRGFGASFGGVNGVALMPGQRCGNAVAVALQRGEAFGVFIGQSAGALFANG